MEIFFCLPSKSKKASRMNFTSYSSIKSIISFSVVTISISPFLRKKGVKEIRKHFMFPLLNAFVRYTNFTELCFLCQIFFTTFLQSYDQTIFLFTALSERMQHMMRKKRNQTYSFQTLIIFS